MVHYSLLVMLNARLCEFSFLGWMLLNLFASLSLYYKWEYCLCIQKSLNLVLPYESTIPTYMRYFRAVLSKFVCVISNFQNEFPFCVLVLLMKWQGWPIFPMLDVLFSRRVFIHLSLHKSKSIMDARSRNQK